MRTRVNFLGAAGKTVEAVREPVSGSLLMTFTDGTYSYAEAEGDSDDYTYLNDLDFDVSDSYATTLAVRYGLMTADEKAAKDADNAAKKEAATAAKERAEYDRLRAKFGG